MNGYALVLEAGNPMVEIHGPVGGGEAFAASVMAAIAEATSDRAEYGRPLSLPAPRIG